MVAVEGDLMSFGGESVSVVTQCVLDLAEDLFGWRVGENFGHFTRPLFEERLEALHESADAGLAVFCRCGCGAIGVGHDKAHRRDLLHQRESGRCLSVLHLHSPDAPSPQGE